MNILWRDRSRRILNLLVEKPKRIGDVTAEFAGVAGFDAAQELANLREKGLIFEEDNRFISLVLTENRQRALLAA